MNEVERVRERYKKRTTADVAGRYHALDPAVYMSSQEKQRALIRWARSCEIAPLDGKRLFEVGCGTGDDLLTFIQLGFRPTNLTAYELLEERIRIARDRLPPGVTLKLGDAAEADLEDGSFDVVYQSTVFTSLLDGSFQEQLARRMWRLAKPGGGILWCDFVYSNPRNPDVRGVRRSRIQELFPLGVMRSWRIGLAPPISRAVTRIHPALYSLVNTVPLLRTHVLCWIQKP